MKIEEALNKAKKFLNENNIDDAALQARILLSSILVCRKEQLHIMQDKNLTTNEENKFFKGIEKISKGYPIQYLTNNKEFMGMDFFVDENVLVPRSDTEILVEETLKICKQTNKENILELCTGSGAIAISLAKYLGRKANIIATDVSEEALNIAKKNAEKLLETKSIEFIKSDMFENIKSKVDIIVSNPPYIKTDIIKKFNLKFEPKLALDGGEDGLKFYRIIIEKGHEYLKGNGVILLEIGYDQKKEVIKLAEETGKYTNIYGMKDLSGNDRVIVINKKMF